jgi:eukaryotic-like serine/threonine-protein kinase
VEPGTRLGRYTIDVPLGRGGMAAVFRAVDDEGATWALKLLTLHRPEVHDRFRSEARVQMGLDHPHLVRARELVEADGQLALVMEYVAGLSLDRFLLERQPTLAERDRIAHQILLAVAHAHAKGLVHRDLKPANVLVLDAPDGPFAKIIDLGLVKEQGVAATRSGIALGTPRYMAPEQIKDAKRVDLRADLWSLGTLFYELYTDHSPFHRDTLVETFSAVLEGAYEDPANHGVPERVRVAIDACLRVEPDERVGSAEALAALLRGDSPATAALAHPPRSLSMPAPIAALPGADATVLLSDTPIPAARTAAGRPGFSWVGPWIAVWSLGFVGLLCLLAFGVLFVGAIAVGGLSDERERPADVRRPPPEPRGKGKGRGR